MLDNLPVGIYIAGTSPIHELRARTKLLLLCWFALIFFAANHNDFHYGVYLLSFGMLALAILVGRVPFSYIWRRMRLLLSAAGAGYSLHADVHPWRYLAYLRAMGRAGALGWPSRRDLRRHLVCRLTRLDFLLLFLGSMILTMTTSPVALAEGIVVLLRPLRRFHVPADEFGLMTLVALRFIPVLVEETEQLIKAQVSRGANFTTGTAGARIRGASSLLVPMLQGALRRAEDLSMAIDARGYGVTGQATLLHEGRLRLLDWLALILIPAATILAYFKF